MDCQSYRNVSRIWHWVQNNTADLQVTSNKKTKTKNKICGALNAHFILSNAAIVDRSGRCARSGITPPPPTPTWRNSMWSGGARGEGGHKNSFQSAFHAITPSDRTLAAIFIYSFQGKGLLTHTHEARGKQRHQKNLNHMSWNVTWKKWTRRVRMFLGLLDPHADP